MTGAAIAEDAADRIRPMEFGGGQGTAAVTAELTAIIDETAVP